MDRMSAAQVVTLILPVFKDYGYDGASLSALSAASGLSRGSLYHHFPGGKQAMAAAVLTRSGAALSRLVMAPLSNNGPATDKITAMFSGVKAYYEGDPPICLMNSLTLGSGRALFGADVRAAVLAWQKSLALVLAEEGVAGDKADKMAVSILENIQGGLIIARVCGSKARFDDAMDLLAREILVTIT